MAQGFTNDTPGLTFPIALALGGTGATLTKDLINQIVTQKITATGTYTPSTGMQFVLVQGCGGGAGGAGGGLSGAAGSGGGGAGGAGWVLLTAAQVGASQAVTIGGGGATSAGGGTTSLGTLLVCTGGTTGTSDPGDNATYFGGDGGVAGTCTTGNPMGSSPGTSGWHALTNLSQGGCGGNGPFGSGGRGRITRTSGSIVGAAATGNGAGGAGMSSSAAASSAGGAGSAGVLYFTEFCSV